MTADIKHANGILIGVCANPSCDNVHIQFTDEDDTTFAQFAIGASDVDNLIDDIRDMRRMAVNKHKGH